MCVRERKGGNRERERERERDRDMGEIDREIEREREVEDITKLPIIDLLLKNVAADV